VVVRRGSKLSSLLLRKKLFCKTFALYKKRP
jgi:hypothetical protein